MGISSNKMSNQSLLMALDQGTTSSRAIVFNTSGQIISVAQQDFPQIYPADGWVEHDPEDIWASTLQVARQALNEAEQGGDKVLAIGITNQRETTVVWDRQTDNPIYNAIVWQDRRTADLCETLKAQGQEDSLRSKTGLLLDPYFSATKVAWILDQVDGARTRAEKAELAFGTIDSFLLWRLTGGRQHLTDITNASRTNLFNIHSCEWDAELLRLFRVPESILPDVKPCCADFGETDAALFGRAIPILGIAGDQQAATIGQACFNAGDIKSTYGTGCFMLANTGTQAKLSSHRLLTTIAYQIGERLDYALEGSIFMAGATVQWLRDGIGIIDSAAETEPLARGIDSNGGVYLVPAFTGLGAPHWAADARAAIYGMTRATGVAELARAALESVCYQTSDLLTAVIDDGLPVKRLRVDGGMVANDWAMQFLADVLNVEVDRPRIAETTALGVAFLAALQSGLFSGLDDIAEHWALESRFTPSMPDQQRTQLLNEWQVAVRKTLAD